MSTRNTKRGTIPTTDLTVREVLAEPALCSTHELRVIAPALVLVLERDAPPRFEMAGCTTRGDWAALKEFIDSDELALAVRSAFYEAGQDDPVLHERWDRHSERLDQGQTLSSLRATY